MDTEYSSYSAVYVIVLTLSDITSQVSDQLEVVPVNVFKLHMSRPSSTGDFGESVTDVDVLQAICVSS